MSDEKSSLIRKGKMTDDELIKALGNISRKAIEGIRDLLQEKKQLQAENERLKNPWVSVGILPEVSKYGCSKYMIVDTGGFNIVTARYWLTDNYWRSPSEIIVHGVIKYMPQPPENGDK